MASSKLGDPELEEFFLAGEEGTYEGGPAHSLSPVAAPPEEHEEPVHSLSPEQIARREGFRRKVTLLVSALGVASSLALTVRLARSPEEGPLGAPVAVAASLAAPVAPAPVALETAFAVSPRPAAPRPEEDSLPGARAAEPAEPAQESPPSEAVAPVRTPSARQNAARKSSVQAEPVRVRREAAAVAELTPERSPALSAVRRAQAAAERRPGGYAPPTVSFPD